jgi:hypothetical protein
VQRWGLLSCPLPICCPGSHGDNIPLPATFFCRGGDNKCPTALELRTVTVAGVSWKVPIALTAVLPRFPRSPESGVALLCGSHRSVLSITFLCSRN